MDLNQWKPGVVPGDNFAFVVEAGTTAVHNKNIDCNIVGIVDIVACNYEGARLVGTEVDNYFVYFVDDYLVEILDCHCSKDVVTSSLI